VQVNALPRCNWSPLDREITLSNEKWMKEREKYGIESEIVSVNISIVEKIMA